MFVLDTVNVYCEVGIKLFIYFQSNLFYVSHVGVEGYCCTWSHTVRLTR